MGSPTTAKANVIHFSYALVAGFHLTNSLLEPTGNAACVKVVARRLLSASAVACHQLILFQAVSIPLMLLLMLALTNYLGRVRMASTAESEILLNSKPWQVLVAILYGFLPVIQLVAPKLKAWINSNHQGTAPVPPTTHQGTVHPVAWTAIGVADPQVSLAPEFEPAGNGVGDRIPTVAEPQQPGLGVKSDDDEEIEDENEDQKQLEMNASSAAPALPDVWIQSCGASRA